MEVCRTVEPPLEPASGDSHHLAACHLEEAVKQREAEQIVSEMMADTA